MKTWKLVSGILSIVFAVFVFFQSMAAGIYDALGNGDSIGSSSGVVVGLILIAGGIISIVTRKSAGKGGNIALIVLFVIAALLGIFMHGSYSDLQIWGVWCLICAVLAIVNMAKNKKNSKEETVKAKKLKK